MRLFPLNATSILFLLFLSALFLVLLFLVPRVVKENRIQDLLHDGKVSVTGAELTIDEFHYTEREGGAQKWEVRADQAKRFLGESRVHMDEVKMNYLLDEGGWVRLSGRAGDYFESEKRVELSGDVQVVTDSGYTLYADRLVWEGEKGLVRSETPVRLVTARYTVRGDRLSFWTESRKVELAGGVRTVIAPSPGTKGGNP